VKELFLQPDPGYAGEGGSSFDKAGTALHRQMVWVRQVRRKCDTKVYAVSDAKNGGPADVSDVDSSGSRPRVRQRSPTPPPRLRCAAKKGRRKAGWNAACFPATHPVFDAGMAAVTQVEGGDVVTFGVGDQAGVLLPGAGVEQELGVRMRALAATDHPHVSGRALQFAHFSQLDKAGEIRKCGSVADIGFGADAL
jgi:hypothetical protein